MPLDAKAASARVERGGWAGICTLWQFRRSKPWCYYIYLSLPQSFPNCHLSLYSDFLLQLAVAGIVVFRSLFGIQLPRCSNARSFSSLHSGKCRCGLKWHMTLLSLVAFPYVDLYACIIKGCTQNCVCKPICEQILARIRFALIHRNQF